MSWLTPKTKLTAAAGLFTSMLGAFAVAIAQKDSRDRFAPVSEATPDYALQSAEPIAVYPPAIASHESDDLEVGEDIASLPPPPSLVVRHNDQSTGLMDRVIQASASMPMEPSDQDLAAAPVEPAGGPVPRTPLEPSVVPAFPGVQPPSVANVPINNLPAAPARPFPDRRIANSDTSAPPISAGPAAAPGAPVTDLTPGLASPSSAALAGGAAEPPSLGGATPAPGTSIPVLPSASGPALPPPPALPPAGSPAPIAPGALPVPELPRLGPAPAAPSFPPPGSPPSGFSSGGSMGQMPGAATATPDNRTAGPALPAPPATPSLLGAASDPAAVPSSLSASPSMQGNPVGRSMPPADSISPVDAMGGASGGRVLIARASALADIPGERALEGTQTPSLQVQKIAPEEVQVGQKTSFTLRVRNLGTSAAEDVVLVDRVPKHTRLESTSPPSQASEDGLLQWSLGRLMPGDERTVMIELVPTEEGEIGSVASVSFSSLASARTVSTLPRLEVTQNADPDVRVGDRMQIQIAVTNRGTGTAKNVSLEVDLPRELRHPSGDALGMSLGDLAPGESRSIPLDLTAVEAGSLLSKIRIVSGNGAPQESSLPIQIIAPKLTLAFQGPKLRYLERPANYQVSIANQGTAPAKDIDIVAYLPKGLQFQSAGNHGEYLADQHAVAWGLDELKPGQTATTDLTLLPMEAGDFVIRLQSQSSDTRAEPLEKGVRVEGLSELAFTIEDDNDPVELDGQSLYTVKVSNSGTRSDSQVEVAIELPVGAKVLQVDAPTRYQVQGNAIRFEAIPEMAPGDQRAFRFRLQLPQEGTQVVRAFLKSLQRPVAVVKEESTQVYTDR